MSKISEMATVLDAHRIDWRYVDWDGTNEIWRGRCRTCGDLPEGASESRHQALALKRAGFGARI